MHLYTNTAVPTLGGDTTLLMSESLQQHSLSRRSSLQQENISKSIWQHLIFSTAMFEKVNGQNNLQALYRFPP